jgi:hypothetical protein
MNFEKPYAGSAGLSPQLHRALWDSLLKNPNDVDTLHLWLKRQGAFEASPDSHRALKAVAAIPGAWLARIWTTRAMLAANRLDEAMALYRDVLASNPNEGLIVQEISGHLGEAGYYDEALHLLLPVYKPKIHGPTAGLNLLHACEDAGDIESGRALAHRMLAAFPMLRPLLWGFIDRLHLNNGGDENSNGHLTNEQ